MEVILLERIEKLGQMGDVVTVKPGYARNFLLPAEKGSSGNRKQQNPSLKISARRLEGREPRATQGCRGRC